MKRNPFGQKQLEILPVGNAQTGVIYLAKRNGITPAENPVDMQEAMTRQTEATLIFLQAVKNCAEQEGVSNADARKLIFPEKQADGTIAEGVDLYDYLAPKEAGRLIGLQEDARQVALQAATLFLQHRLVYPVIVTEDAKSKANQLTVEPLRFQVAGQNKFKFGDVTIEATEEAGFDAEILMVGPLPRKIEAGEIGYLTDMTGRIKIGDPDWTIEHTREFLMEPQIEAIYQFYQAEIGQAPATTDDGAENLTTPSPALLTASTENPSTGRKSIGASKATELPTIDSTATTLATSPTG